MVAAKLWRRCHGGRQYQLLVSAGLRWGVGEHVALVCASILAQHDSGSGCAHRPDEGCRWDFYEDRRIPMVRLACRD